MSLKGKLQKTTQKAKKSITEEQKAKREREAAGRDQVSIAVRLRAELIIAHLEEDAEIEAKKGNTSVVLMKLTYEEYAGVSGNVCKVSDLKGAAILVHNHCVSEGLAPTIEYWHDGYGINSGYNIVIHW